MQRLSILALLMVALAMLGGCGSTALRGGVYEPPQAAADFTLPAHDGSSFHLADQRGKVVLLYFGYMTCPDICPTTLGDLAAARRRLGEAGNMVKVIFISLDPERDSLDRMGDYVHAFDPTFIGLRGATNQLASVLRDYQVTAERRQLSNSTIGYVIDHSSFVYVIDQQGILRELITDKTPVEDIVYDLHILLQERSAR